MEYTVMSGDGENGRDTDDSDASNDDSDGSGDAERDPRASRVTSLSIDATLELLADYDRRRILVYLMDASDGTASVDELVDHLVASRSEQSSDPPDRDRIATKVHHVYLPELVDAGVVEYDARSGEIRYWGEDRLEAWLGHIRSREAD